MPRVDIADKLRDVRGRLEVQSAGETERDLPKFARLTRKEARVREDQYRALSALARRLMRRRQAKGERITENTLIRVAIDLLLAASKSFVARLRSNSGTLSVRTSASRGVRQSGTLALPGFGSHRPP